MKRFLSLAETFSFLIFCASASAQVDQILQSIEHEQANPKITHSQASVGIQEKKPKRVKSFTEASEINQKAPPTTRPSVKMWGPKDRLPGNIAGQYLVGDFMVLGEYVDGGAVIYAVEDDGKGFIRQFVVKNASSGLAPGNYYPDGQKPRVSFTSSNPLVFTAKLFPGLYSVQTTR